MKSTTRGLLLLSVLTASLAGVTGCSSTLEYTPRSMAGAPEADAVITADRNQDQRTTMMRLNVSHLASPDRVAAGTTAYVVWARPDANTPWTRVGMLNYSTADRTGALEATVPFLRFEVLMTAEITLGVATPSTHIVVSQTVGT